MIDLESPGTQSVMSELVGVSQPTISGYVSRGILTPSATLARWLVEYCSHLREMAAGRATDGTIDLPTERALLARAQREGQEIKNEVARGTYAPIEVLADVLADASQSIADHLDQLPAGIARVCPELPQAVRNLIMTTVARARNEWVRKTIDLAADKLDQGDIQEEDEPTLLVDDEDIRHFETTKGDDHE